MSGIVVFADYTPFSAAHLCACLDGGHEVKAVVVTGKWKAKRKRERLLSLLAPRWSLKALIRRHRIPLIVVRRPVDGAVLAAQLTPLGATLLVSAGFGARIPRAAIAIFPDGAINIHPALLPNYRGPHPTFAMLRDGMLPDHAGITIHALTEEFDEGAIVAQAPLDGAGFLPMQSIDAALSVLGNQLLRTTLADLPARLAAANPQPPGTFLSGRASVSDFIIQPGIEPAVLARRMSAEMLGYYPRIEVGARTIPLAGPVRRIGPPTGKAPVIRPLSVTLDTSDSRVRISRARNFRRRWRHWQRAFSLARQPLT